MDSITICQGCRKNKPLKPFFVFQDPEQYRVTDADFKHLCARCYEMAIQDRETNGPIPYWYTIAMRFRDYVPPSPVLTLKQSDFL